jgi:hypothetical protein
MNEQARMFISTAAALFVLLSFQSCTPTPYQLNNDKEGAYVAAEQAVERLLKAPASADFPAPSKATIQKISDTEGFTIAAYVDAQNAFGAKIRTRWFCKVTETTRDHYDTSCNFVE